MVGKVAVAVIHGMGSQDVGFSDDMRDEVIDKVHNRNSRQNFIEWQEIHWADILKQRQVDYLDAARAAQDLDYVALRRLVVSYLSDAVSYRKVESGFDTTYEKIHKKVEDAIASLDARTAPGGGMPNETPLVFLAHSLGGHIVSNYIWDTRIAHPTPATFSELQTVTGIITFGCNIPLFTFAFDPVVPITLPPPGLPANLVPFKKWDNYYDSDDILAYPLRTINAAYSGVVDDDIEISVGGLLTGLTPLSHNLYWTDNDFTDPVADYLASFASA